MKVTCQACSAQYTIADEKVKGRKVKIRCKACQTPIVVDGQNPPLQAVGSGNSEPPPTLDPFAPETAVAADADVWNVNLSDTDSRTMTTAEVIEGFRSGVVTNDAFVWKDGMGDWIPIMDCVELAPLLSGPTDPPVPVAGQTPLAPAVVAGAKLGGVPMLSGQAGTPGASAARTASAKAQAGADLFGNLDAAGSEDVEVAVGGRGVPVLPGATAYDDKPTGQRNENSVLFSLDAMKAGFVAPAPAPKSSKPSAPVPGAPRPTQPSNPDDPFGMGGAALGGPGGNPIFSLNANQALVTAPAPPEPKPQPVVVYAAPGSIPPGMDEKTKKMVIFGAAGAGAVIMLLLSLVIFGGGKKSETDADSAKAAVSAQADETKKDEKKEEPKAEEKKEEPEAAKPAASEEKKAEETAKTETAKTDTAKAGTSHGSSSTPSTKKEEPAAAGPSTAPPFSKASAISALGSASSSAGSCKKAGGPTGVGKVQVTFAPSGKVTSATVMGPPFAGTAVGGCVASAFRRAKVPAFSGNAVTVSKSFAVN
ncbi:MAG TPA: zinc-ribbon domain-containing protein [Polyangiaceae bacterium]|nr:zinc-ribbon domain-containing protein [Polyangiaceae bacterium]